MNLRLATLADLPQGLELFSESINESVYSMFELDVEKAFLYITDLVRNKRVAVVEVEHEGVKLIVAALAVDVVTYPFTNDNCLLQKFFYVRKPWRATDAARLLRNSAVDYAKTVGLPLLMDHLAGAGDLERKDEFFQRAGFEKIGATFLYRG